MVTNPPWVTVGKVGETERRTVDCDTAREIVVVADSPPDTPEIVNIVVPRGTLGATLRVTVLLPVVGLFTHVAVTPLGSGVVKARLTLPLRPPKYAVSIVVETEPPCCVVKLAGAALIANPAALTPNVRTVLAVIVPEVPVIVTPYDPRCAVAPTVKLS